jgi:Na+/alanine symporter
MSKLREVTDDDAQPDPVLAAAHAAVATAIADGMVRGVLIYENEIGVGRAPLFAGIATIRGLCLYTLEDIRADTE